MKDELARQAVKDLGGALGAYVSIYDHCKEVNVHRPNPTNDMLQQQITAICDHLGIGLSHREVGSYEAYSLAGPKIEPGK